MPFQSKKQARAAFGGYLGPEMKEKADQWAHETPGGIKSLPESKPSPSSPIHAPHAHNPRPRNR